MLETFWLYFNNIPSSLEKNNEVTFYTVGYDARAIELTLNLLVTTETA